MKNTSKLVSNVETTSLPIRKFSFKTRFIVNPLTVVLITISLIFGRFNYLFVHYIIAFIHEFFHFLAAKLVKIEVESFVFLPFGFYAKMPNLEKGRPLAELFVVIMGPLSYFVVTLILFVLLQHSLISPYAYHYAKSSALTILLFNLIPLYPLDGARIIEIVIARYLDEYKVRILRVLLTIVSFGFLAYLCVIENQVLVLFFLTFSTLSEVLFFKKKYHQFLLYRLFDESKRPLKIVRKNKIYRYYENRQIELGKMMPEKEVVKKAISDLRLK